MDQSESPFLNFADDLLIKIVGFLPMEDRINVRESCSRMEKIVADTDLEMPRYLMWFDNFDATPMSTPFGLRSQGMDSAKLEEFVTARNRLTKSIKLAEVVLYQIDLERANFDSVRLLLANCSFNTLYIVQYNVQYDERVEALIEEYKDKKIVLSALNFPYVQCVERLSADVELRFNYLLRDKVPSGGGKNEDLLLDLARKGHNLCISTWSNPESITEISQILSESDREQLVIIKTSDLAAFCSSVGVNKIEGGLELQPGQGSHSLRRITGRNRESSFWSFAHGEGLFVMTDGEAHLWLSNRPFAMSMDTCIMHCGLCESMRTRKGADYHWAGGELCDRCVVCRCVHFRRF